MHEDSIEYAMEMIAREGLERGFRSCKTVEQQRLAIDMAVEIGECRIIRMVIRCNWVNPHWKVSEYAAARLPDTVRKLVELELQDPSADSLKALGELFGMRSTPADCKVIALEGIRRLTSRKNFNKIKKDILKSPKRTDQVDMSKYRKVVAQFRQKRFQEMAARKLTH